MYTGGSVLDSNFNIISALFECHFLRGVGGGVGVVVGGGGEVGGEVGG